MNLPVEQLCAMLDEKIRALESIPNEETRDQVFAILQLVDQLHRGGIQKIAETFRDAPAWKELCQDESVNVLLNFYDQLELDDTEQVEQTLDMVRPYIESHGGKLELLKVDEGRVHIKLAGACESCSGTEATLKHGVEEALKAGYPKYETIVVENVTDQKAPNLVQLKANVPTSVRVNAPVFENLLRLDEIPESQPTMIQADGRNLVLARHGTEIACFDPECHSCGGTFAQGQVRGNIVMCERSNCAYDFRTGRQVDGGEASLRIYPITVNDGTVAVAINVKPSVLLRQS